MKQLSATLAAAGIRVSCMVGQGYDRNVAMFGRKHKVQ